MSSTATSQGVVRGEGPLIVLLPSLGRGAEDFSALAGMLADQGFRVTVFEPRGAGPSRRETLHDLAAEVAAEIVALGGGPAIIVGHAFGNWVARTLAADRPDLACAVVLAAAAKKAPLEDWVIAGIDRCQDASLSEAERLAALRLIFFAPGNDPRPWLEGWNPALAVRQRAAASATSREEWWDAGGRLPLLDLQAEQDAVAPMRLSTELKDELGERVTIRVIAKAGHALIPEQPAAVAGAIADFARAVGHCP